MLDFCAPSCNWSFFQVQRSSSFIQQTLMKKYVMFSEYSLKSCQCWHKCLEFDFIRLFSIMKIWFINRVDNVN